MKNTSKMEILKDMKITAIKLYEMYIMQSNQDELGMNCYHENEHDNSGGHPDYHNNSHDNTPGITMTRTLVKNATN